MHSHPLVQHWFPFEMIAIVISGNRTQWWHLSNLIAINGWLRQALPKYVVAQHLDLVFALHSICIFFIISDIHSKYICKKNYCSLLFQLLLLYFLENISEWKTYPVSTSCSVFTRWQIFTAKDYCQETFWLIADPTAKTKNVEKVHETTFIVYTVKLLWLMVNGYGSCVQEKLLMYVTCAWWSSYCA